MAKKQKSEAVIVLERMVKRYKVEIAFHSKELREAISGRCWERAAEMETRLDILMSVWDDIHFYLRSENDKKK